MGTQLQLKLKSQPFCGGGIAMAPVAKARLQKQVGMRCTEHQEMQDKAHLQRTPHEDEGRDEGRDDKGERKSHILMEPSEPPKAAVRASSLIAAE